MDSDVDGVRLNSMSVYRLARKVTVMQPEFDPMSSARDQAGDPS
jgi:hypothetical protein